MEGDFAPDVIHWESSESRQAVPSENLCHPRHFLQRLRLRTILCGSRPDYKRTYLRTAAGMNAPRWQKQSGTPSSMIGSLHALLLRRAIPHLMCRMRREMCVEGRFRT